MAGFTCPVCEEESATAKLLPCRHQLCSACVGKWADRDSTCPTCRKAFVGHAAQLPTVYHATLHCFTCERSQPMFMLHMCVECSELVCGSCHLSGVTHDPAHRVEPFAQLRFVKSAAATLKRKAGCEGAGPVRAKAARLQALALEELGDAVRAKSHQLGLRKRLLSAFGLGDGADEGMADTQPSAEARAGLLIKAMGAEAPASAETNSALESVQALDDGRLRRLLRSALSDAAHAQAPPLIDKLNRPGMSSLSILWIQMQTEPELGPPPPLLPQWEGSFVARVGRNGERTYRPNTIYKIRSNTEVNVYTRCEVDASSESWPYKHDKRREAWSGRLEEFFPVLVHPPGDALLHPSSGFVEGQVFLDTRPLRLNLPRP